MIIRRRISQDLLDDINDLNWSNVNNCYTIAKMIRDHLGLYTPQFQVTSPDNTAQNSRDINENLTDWQECEYMRHGSIALLGHIKSFNHVAVVIGSLLYHIDKNGFNIQKLSAIKRKYKKVGFYEQSCNL